MYIDLPEFEDKDVVIIGAGREGKSFEKFITDLGRIRSVRFVDQKDGPDYLENLRNLDFTQTVIVKTPGCPGKDVPAPYTTATKVFFDCARQIGAKIIGVTGTKGKTTTASLLAHILRNAGLQVVLAGNMGDPMISTLETADEHTVFVLELSSYQLAELEVSPDLALITNLYRDHIDYHGTLENYWEAKRNIMRYMGSDQTLIYNPDFDMIHHWVAESDAHTITIDTTEPVNMSDTKLIGEHNKLNFLLAKAAAQALGIDNATINNSFKTFEPIPHRLQNVRTVKGVTFIDDAIASQPEAAIAGITACVREVGPVGCVLLGGQDREYDFESLTRLLHTLLIPNVVLFPDSGAKIKEAFPENYSPNILETSDMEEAVSWAAENTPSGSVCLLSTASPSYSVWKDFEEKGNLFQEAVQKLSN